MRHPRAHAELARKPKDAAVGGGHREHDDRFERHARAMTGEHRQRPRNGVKRAPVKHEERIEDTAATATCVQEYVGLPLAEIAWSCTQTSHW